MIVHYHIPKTAGTSVKRVLEAHFSLIRAETLKDPKAARPDFEDASHCISGHFASSLSGDPESLIDTLPEIVGNPLLRPFTILRDPLEHLVSTYYHHRDSTNKISGKLIDFVREGNRFMYRYSLNAFDENTIDACIQSFYFIGDAANLSASMDYLCDLLEKPRIAVPHQNVGTRDLQLLELTARERSRIENALAPEYELYEKVKSQIASKGFSGLPETRQAQFRYVIDQPVERNYFTISSEGEAPGEPAATSPDVEFVKREMLEIVRIKEQKAAEVAELLTAEKSKVAGLEEILKEKETTIETLKASLVEQNAAMDAFRIKAEEISRGQNEKFDALLANFNKQADALNEYREKADALSRSHVQKYDALLANFNRQAAALDEYRSKSEQNIEAHKKKYDLLLDQYSQREEIIKTIRSKFETTLASQRDRYATLLAKFNEQAAALHSMREFVRSQSLKIARLRESANIKKPESSTSPLVPVAEPVQQDLLSGEEIKSGGKPSRKKAAPAKTAQA